MSFDQATIKHITGLLDIDGAPYPPSITPVVLPLNHIPTGTGTFPPLQDSGIIISHPSATQTAIDFLPSVPNTVVVGYDTATGTLTLYNALGGAISSVTRGIVMQAVPTKAAIASSDTLVHLIETTDGHEVIMNTSGINLSAGNGKPVLITSGAASHIALNGMQVDTSGNLSGNSVGVGVVVGTPAINLNGATSILTMTVQAGGASYPLVFPSAQGAASSVLVNDGAGNLSWQVITIP